MNKLIRRPDIWISFALFLLMIPAERLELFSSMENWLQGNRHIVRLNTLDADKTQFAYDDIIIVDTEEDFFDEYGSWPLKRSDIAKLTTIIKKLGAEVIALDMLMDFPNGYDEDPILLKLWNQQGILLLWHSLNLTETGISRVSTIQQKLSRSQLKAVILTTL